MRVLKLFIAVVALYIATPNGVWALNVCKEGQDIYCSANQYGYQCGSSGPQPCRPCPSSHPYSAPGTTDASGCYGTVITSDITSGCKRTTTYQSCYCEPVDASFSGEVTTCNNAGCFGNVNQLVDCDVNGDCTGCYKSGNACIKQCTQTTGYDTIGNYITGANTTISCEA